MSYGSGEASDSKVIRRMSSGFNDHHGQCLIPLSELSFLFVCRPLMADPQAAAVAQYLSDCHDKNLSAFHL
jgi:hypothetical protein